MKYVSPEPMLGAFNCPYCRAFAHQIWFGIGARSIPKKDANADAILNPSTYEEGDSLAFFNLKHGILNLGVSAALASQCVSCEHVAIWIAGTLAHPIVGDAPAANADLPEDIRRDYEEASSILDRSPRGAAALIRLAIQKLCKQLGQSGENINADIGELVKLGLDPRVQQALDAVRVIGNNAVHPGKMDLRDDRATALSLFKLLNLVVEKTISEPKHVAEVYASLPQSNLAAIEKRDQGK
jgi:Domain of unknown function (DUF4145)